MYTTFVPFIVLWRLYGHMSRVEVERSSSDRLLAENYVCVGRCVNTKYTGITTSA